MDPIPQWSCDRVHVGVAALLTKKINGETFVLLGRRIASHGAFTLQLPGGHLEIGESWEECVVRETREETGYEISVEQAQFLHTTNDVFQAEKKHYVTIFMQVNLTQEQIERSDLPQVLEKEKCEWWRFFPWKQLLHEMDEKELFLPLAHLVRDVRAGVVHIK